MTLSTFSRPLSSLNLPGRTCERVICWAMAAYKVSRMRVDFPPPLTPAIAINMPSGSVKSTFLRLFSQHPVIVIQLFFPYLLLAFGTSIFMAPERNIPVIPLFDFITSSGVPAEMTSPPYLPAPGPMSMR